MTRRVIIERIDSRII